MVQRGLRNKKVGNRRTVPHAVMMGKVALKLECTLEDVRRRGNNFEAGVKFIPQSIVVERRTCGIELLQLADRADV